VCEFVHDGFGASGRESSLPSASHDGYVRAMLACCVEDLLRHPVGEDCVRLDGYARLLCVLSGVLENSVLSAFESPRLRSAS